MTQESERREAVRNSWLTHPPAVRRDGSVKAKQRRQVLAEEPICYLCRNAPSTEVDHKIPRCLGGSDDRPNLGGACRPCHLSKSGREANHVRWHVKKIPSRKQPLEALAHA